MNWNRLDFITLWNQLSFINLWKKTRGSKLRRKLWSLELEKAIDYETKIIIINKSYSQQILNI